MSSYYSDLSKFTLFTHAGCMDGSASALIFLHSGGMKKNIKFVQAGHFDDTFMDSNMSKNDTPCLFVDIAPSTEAVAQLISNRRFAWVIDHHASAVKFSMYPGFHVNVENTACGSESLRQWLVDRGVKKFDTQAWKRFTRIIDDHDRWQLKIPFSLEMPKFFSFVGQQEFITRFMDVETRFAEEKCSYWNPFEAELMVLVDREQTRRFNRDLKRFVVIEREFDGKKTKIGYVISGEVNNSEMLNIYLKQHPEVDAACQICPDLNKVSLRSNNKLDITSFTAIYGGGGHKNSGGHGLPDELTRKVADLVHYKNL